MKSFKEYLKESTVLMDLINKHDDPFSFLAASMDAISSGTLKLKQRGLANARELIAAWNKVKKRKIKLKEATEYILERRQDLVKGWTLKNKIVISTNDYDYYHIKQIIKEPRKFGLDKRKILKILADSAESMSVPNPEAYVEDQYESLADGIVDNDVYIEEYIMKKGYCRFVIDKTHGSIEGWNEKNCKLGAKALDDTYLPYERDGFKLFEVKPLNPFKPKYITSKFDWYDWLEGKAERKYVSPMAQFRESTNQVEYVLWGVPPGEREEVLVLDAPGGKPITKLSSAKKYKAVLEKEHGVTKIRIQTIDFSQDLSKMFTTNKKLVK